MESEEYIADLEEMRTDVAQRFGKECQYVETLTKAITLVDRDEGRRVKFHAGGFASCPNCNQLFELLENFWGCCYCPNCGQHLRWNDV